MAEDIPELKLAFLGPTQVGKTALLASYFGNSKRIVRGEEWLPFLSQRHRGPSKHRLEDRFQSLREGKFPDPTVQAHRYKFSMEVRGFARSACHVMWHDFPGGWLLNEAADAEEQIERRKHLRDIGESDALVLLIDGGDVRERGAGAVSRVLALYTKYFRDLAEDGQQRAPKLCMLALTKADLRLPPPRRCALSRSTRGEGGGRRRVSGVV